MLTGREEKTATEVGKSRVLPNIGVEPGQMVS